jgi:hypothetical protein
LWGETFDVFDWIINHKCSVKSDKFSNSTNQGDQCPRNSDHRDWSHPTLLTLWDQRRFERVLRHTISIYLSICGTLSIDTSFWFRTQRWI